MRADISVGPAGQSLILGVLDKLRLKFGIGQGSLAN